MRPRVLVALAATLVLLPATPALAGDWSSRSTPPRLPGVPQALSGFGEAVSCAAPGQCAAVVSYATFAGQSATRQENVLVGQYFGVWSRGVRAPLPRRLGHPRVVEIEALSCAAVGDCTAVGSYRTPAGRTQPLIWTQASGAWRPAIAPAIPGEDAELTAVSCFVPDDCAAAGSRDGKVLLISKVGGRWRQPAAAVTLPPDAGASGEAAVGAVSCGGRGSCSAVGSYRDDAGRGQGLLLDSAVGRWSPGERVEAPADADPAAAATNAVVLYAVSCSAPGHCSATGRYPVPGGGGDDGAGLVLSRNASGWGPATSVAPPAGTEPTDVLPFAVSCAEPAECTAVGVWYGKGGSPTTILLDRSGGVWSQATTPPPPPDGSDTASYLTDVSCGAPGDCGAAGWSYARGALLSEAMGTWTTSVRPPPPGFQGVTVRSVSCPTAGHCAAAGDDNGTTSRPILFSRGAVSGPASRIEVRAALRDGLGTLDAAGAVHLLLPKAGTVRVRLSAGGRVLGSGTAAVARRGPATVDVALTPAGEARLARGGSLAGVATFVPAGGRPVTARR